MTYFKLFMASSQEIIERLPEKFQKGSVFLDENDAWIYLGFYVGVTIIFWLVYHVYRLVFLKSKYSFYLEKDEDDRVWYTLAWVTITHHWLILPMIYYVFYNSCSNMDGWPWPSEEGGTYSKLGSTKKWGYFKDEMCFIEANKGYVFIMLFSMAYMTHDWYQM